MPFPSRRPSLEDAFDPDANGFTVLRAGLALLVVLSHAFVVGGFGDDPGMVLSGGRTQLGTVAVMSFLVLSGFLVTRSRERITVTGFLWHRTLRIMPAYWVCLAITALVIAPLAALVAGTGLQPAAALQYIADNALLVQFAPFIGEVFAQNPWALTVNGSLWTLAPEVACYVGLLLLPPRALRAVAPGLIVGLVVVHLLRTSGVAPDVLAVDFPLAFALGAAAWLFRSHIPIVAGGAAIAVVGTMVAIWAGAFIAVGLPFVAYLVLWAGVTIRRPVRTDLSYGIYIYAFPLQQLAATLGATALGFFPFLAIGSTLAVGAAAISWRYVERPALALKRQTLARTHPLAQPGRGVDPVLR